jgi:hypothetical protein
MYCHANTTAIETTVNRSSQGIKCPEIKLKQMATAKNINAILK